MADGASKARFIELVALMAMLMSLTALSIDAMLPALGRIGSDLAVERANDVQLVVSFLLAGMALGQIGYGPLSDALGRRPAIFLGLILFTLGSLLCYRASSFPMLLAGRGLQGLGVAGPRVIAVAIIRDQYEGREMARVMSFVLAVFIFVPVVAPALGQLILEVATWRAIFGAFLALAAFVSTWFALRQPETLARERRIPFTLRRIAGGIREVVGNRVAFGYTVASGMVFGAFLGYLSTAQQLFQGLYGVGNLFALYFAGLSIAIGAASLLNARLVMKLGMTRLSRSALVVMTVASAAFWGWATAWSGAPPLWSLLVYLLLVFFCDGILYSNMNALAMEPLGHIAGMGAAVVGTLSMIISIAGGTVVGQAYDETVVPLVVGFGVLSVASLAAMRWAASGAGAMTAGVPRFETETNKEGSSV